MIKREWIKHVGRSPAYTLATRLGDSPSILGGIPVEHVSEITIHRDPLKIEAGKLWQQVDAMDTKHGVQPVPWNQHLASQVDVWVPDSVEPIFYEPRYGYLFALVTKVPRDIPAARRRAIQSLTDAATKAASVGIDAATMEDCIKKGGEAFNVLLGPS